MTTRTHQTAPTRFVEANGIRFAYRPVSTSRYGIYMANRATPRTCGGK